MALTAAQKAALAAKKKAAAAAEAAKNKPKPAPAKPKATPSPAPAPIDGPRNPLNVPFSQRLNAAITKLLKEQGASDQDIATQLAAADTIMEKDALLRRLKNPQDADPISTPADLGPVPKKKGQRKGKKDDTPAPIEEDDAEVEAEEEPKPKKKGRSTKGQPRAKDGKYNMPEGPLPEAVKPDKAAAKTAPKKAKKVATDENLDAEEEVAAPPKRVSSKAEYLPGYRDPILAPVYGAAKALYKYPVSLPVGGTLAAYLAAQALKGFAPAPPASSPPPGPPMAVGDTQQPPGGEFIPVLPPDEDEEEQMPARGQAIPQEDMAEGMEQDGERRFFFEKPANPAGGPTDIIRQYRQNR
jgi:hypothetical protein